MKYATIYRIYVGLTTQDGVDISAEEAGTATLTALSEVCGKGATILKGLDVWEGNVEECFVVEVVASPPASLSGEMRSVALRLKRDLNQAAVLLTSAPAQSEVV